MDQKFARVITGTMFKHSRLISENEFDSIPISELSDLTTFDGDIGYYNANITLGEHVTKQEFIDWMLKNGIATKGTRKNSPYYINGLKLANAIQADVYDAVGVDDDLDDMVDSIVIDRLFGDNDADVIRNIYRYSYSQERSMFERLLETVFERVNRKPASKSHAVTDYIPPPKKEKPVKAVTLDESIDISLCFYKIFNSMVSMVKSNFNHSMVKVSIKPPRTYQEREEFLGQLSKTLAGSNYWYNNCTEKSRSELRALIDLLKLAKPTNNKQRSLKAGLVSHCYYL